MQLLRINLINFITNFKYSRSFKVATLFALLAASGCAATHGNQQGTGAIIGGGLGGILGSQIGSGAGNTAAIIVGTLTGAAIGSNIGRTMDEVDRMRIAEALETQPTGSSTQWINPDSRQAYIVTPVRTFQVNQEPCREFIMDVKIENRNEKVSGTACRTASGNWIMSN